MLKRGEMTNSVNWSSLATVWAKTSAIAVIRARANSVHLSFVEVEVDTLEQLALVMPAGAAPESDRLRSLAKRLVAPREATGYGRRDGRS